MTDISRVGTIGAESRAESGARAARLGFFDIAAR